MNALLFIPIAAILLAVIYRPARPERIGFVERSPKGSRPMPPMSRRQRLIRWQALYGQTSVEQQTDPGAWPFVPSAVHALPKGQQTDPRQLAAYIIERTK